MPTFDRAVASLLTDLAGRGLLSATLAVALAQVGRTPVGSSRWGRGHWSTLFPALLAGAGVRGGTTFGRSDKDAPPPAAHPGSPESLAATVYEALGISPELRLPDPQGRPTPIVQDGRSI